MEPLLNLRNPGDKPRKCLILAICSQTVSGKYSFTVFSYITSTVGTGLVKSKGFLLVFVIQKIICFVLNLCFQAKNSMTVIFHPLLQYEEQCQRSLSLAQLVYFLCCVLVIRHFQMSLQLPSFLCLYSCLLGWTCM